jgi:hypothetical protein
MEHCYWTVIVATTGPHSTLQTGRSRLIDRDPVSLNKPDPDSAEPAGAGLVDPLQTPVVVGRGQAESPARRRRRRSSSRSSPTFTPPGDLCASAGQRVAPDTDLDVPPAVPSLYTPSGLVGT